MDDVAAKQLLDRFFMLAVVWALGQDNAIGKPAGAEVLAVREDVLKAMQSQDGE